MNDFDALLLTTSEAHVSALHIVDKNTRPNRFTDASLPEVVGMHGCVELAQIGSEEARVDMVGNIVDLDEMRIAKRRASLFELLEDFVLHPVAAHRHDVVRLTIGVLVDKAPEKLLRLMVDERVVEVPREDGMVF